MPTTWPYPRVLAHRGGGALAPENTLAALETGARHGHTMVEFDVKLSADDVAYLLHDDTVNRTSDGTGESAEFTFAELSELDAGSWFAPEFAGVRMPSFARAAARCRELGLLANVEIKPNPGTDAATGRAVALAAADLWSGAAVPPLLSSFSATALAAAAEAVPDQPRGMLYERIPADWKTETAALGCVSLHADHSELDEALVATIRAAGLRILAYTVNDPARARELASWGVDLVCTDRIDTIGPGFLG
ncbi:glycerophosphodiester phosphodiesterase [Nocardia stercoris]|uniref:Glycerophosphodiester phosphodiesterase n=1 Tax=Nocardia stercoris TaxID=2483361 RepID=A0A3M2LE86_9NOCA|nr:glycerophosphodiester phosphodiesterase [Nocardia stercoris]RMI35841.1 glycerophosphodiester phosphodiesterase [Nocardia stercoris]